MDTYKQEKNEKQNENSNYQLLEEEISKLHNQDLVGNFRLLQNSVSNNVVVKESFNGDAYFFK